jgi:hypothetical protein
VRADPRTRWIALAAVVGIAIAGGVAIGWLTPLLTRAAEQGALGPLPAGTRSLCWLFLGLVTLMALPVVAFGVHAIRLGKRVRMQGRFPPIEMRVVRDTRVLVGPSAQLVGKGQIVIGAVLITCAVMLVAVSGYAVMMLLGRVGS